MKCSWGDYLKILEISTRTIVTIYILEKRRNSSHYILRIILFKDIWYLLLKKFIKMPHPKFAKPYNYLFKGSKHLFAMILKYCIVV